MSKSKQNFVVCDIECDGPNVLKNSMIALGAVIIDKNFSYISSFYRNIKPLDGHTSDPKTTDWWMTKEPLAYAATQINQIEASIAIQEFVDWVEQFAKRNAVCVAFPAAFDFSFLYPYIETFADSNPFGHQCLDMKTLAMSILGVSFLDVRKNRMPKQWFDSTLPHTHNALDDALETTYIFTQMMKTLETKTLTHASLWTNLLLFHLESCGYKLPEKEISNIRKSLTKQD